MKKYTFFAVALATLAFVGCNKKDNNLVPDANGKVTIMLSGEKYVSQDKQSFSGVGDQIFFTNDDYMYVNGVSCPVVCIPNPEMIGTSSTESNLGSVAIPAEQIYNPLYALYPAAIFTPGTAADYSDWTVNMKNEVVLIPKTVQLGYQTPMGAAQQIWPLTAYVPDVTLNNNIQLKNNVALMTPCVIYGPGFISRFTNVKVTGETFDGTDYPTLKVQKVVLSSDNGRLTGEGHIAGLNTDEPYLVMDGAAPTEANPDVLTLWVTDPVVEPEGLEVLSNGESEVRLGHAPIAPVVEGNINVHLAVYFTLTYPGTNHTYACVYEGNGVFNNTNVKRSQRSSLMCDFFSTDGVSKVTSVVLQQE